ncbi:hypothetical protein M569_12781, partial [Genlisea aurea]
EALFISLLRKCKSTSDLKRIHTQMEKHSLFRSSFLVTKMLDVCDQNGDIEYAGFLFRKVPEPNIFLYNAVIRVYTNNGYYLLAIDAYKQLLGSSLFPDRFTFPFLIRACRGLLDLQLGKQVHGHVFKHGLVKNVMVENSLLDMYVKCDAIADGHSVFDRMSERDVVCWNSLISGNMKLGRLRTAGALFEGMPVRNTVSWTTMISGYAKAGSFGDALSVFRRMQLSGGVEPDWISLVAVLPACSQLGGFETGRWIHRYADRKGLLRITPLCNALMEMYMKCGDVERAMQLFDTIPERDVISWSTAISGLASHGGAREALDLFRRMQELKTEPNGITFVGLLSACAHAGLLDQGLKYFELMQKAYNIEPGVEHYGCIVDLLGRAGKIPEAMEVIEGMEVEPNVEIWSSVLSSCRNHRNLEAAVVATGRLMELEPDGAGNLVALANVCGDLQMWEGVKSLREMIRRRRRRRVGGCSMIEVNCGVHGFVSGD